MGPSPAECLMWNLVDFTLVVLNWISLLGMSTLRLELVSSDSGSILSARTLHGWFLIVEVVEFCSSSG